MKCGEVRARERKKREERCFKEWNENGVKDWRDSEWGGENCLKQNGISSLLKIGGRMLRYGFCPIFINEKMRKSAGECQ